VTVVRSGGEEQTMLDVNAVRARDPPRKSLSFPASYLAARKRPIFSFTYLTERYF
jgi:hypothetical protein